MRGSRAIMRQIAAALAVIVVAVTVQTAGPALVADQASALAAVLKLVKGPVPAGAEAQMTRETTVLETPAMRPMS